MYAFSFEQRSGILRVKVTGSWTLPDVARYASEAGLQFEKARGLAGRLRLLVDLARTDILSQDVIDPLAKAGMQYSQPTDKVAIVVQSMLMKLQMKRMIGDAPSPIFLSEAEAASWLMSTDC
jgi:hypothetical protein